MELLVILAYNVEEGSICLRSKCCGYCIYTIDAVQLALVHNIAVDTIEGCVRKALVAIHQSFTGRTLRALVPITVFDDAAVGTLVPRLTLTRVVVPGDLADPVVEAGVDPAGVVRDHSFLDLHCAHLAKRLLDSYIFSKIKLKQFHNFSSLVAITKLNILDNSFKELKVSSRCKNINLTNAAGENGFRVNRREVF